MSFAVSWHWRDYMQKPVIHVLMYGKRPIAAFHSKAKADNALITLKGVIPSSYPVKPHVVKIPLQG